MKRNLFVIFTVLIFVTVISCKGGANKNLVIEDLEYFQDVFKNGYVSFDEINRVTPIEFNIKEMARTYRKNESWRRRKKLDSSFENGINQEAMAVTILKFLREFEIDDGHLALYTNKYYFPVMDSRDEDAPTVSDKTFLKIAETENSLYIRSGTFHISKGTAEEKLLYNVSKEISVKSKEKDFIVIDLRGNSGGITYCPQLLTAAIYESIDDPDLENEDPNLVKVLKFLDYAEWGSYELHSAVTAKRNYEKAIERNEPQFMIDAAKADYEKEQKRNKKHYTGLENAALSSLPQYSEWYDVKLSAKIIVVIDNYTASAAEKFISYLYLMDKDNVTLVGGNTDGDLCYGGILTYTLPNSKVEIDLASVSNKNTTVLKFVENWKGENIGFEPDYKVPAKGRESECVETLTKDKELAKIVTEIK